MAMAVQGSRQQGGGGGGGVKVKFIETQFVSSDAASFKAVVQRLTGKSPASPPPPPAATVPPSRPRPCRPAFGGGSHAAGWGAEHAAGHHHLVMPAKQEPYAAPPQRLEELHELCDFADLLYATAGATRDGFPY